MVEAQLRSPGEFDNRWWHVELPLLERRPNAWCVAGVMRRLAKDVSQQAVARFGDRPAVLLAAAGAFGWHSTGVRHELRCGSEPMQITSFSWC
jgi:hypothetical protein